MRLPVAWSWVNSSGEIRTPWQLVLSRWSLLRKAIWLRNTYNDVFVWLSTQSSNPPPSACWTVQSRVISLQPWRASSRSVLPWQSFSAFLSLSLLQIDQKREKKQTTCWFPILLGFWHTAAWVRRERNFSARLFSPCPSSLPSGEIFFLFTRLATLSPSFFLFRLESARMIFIHLHLCFFFLRCSIASKVTWLDERLAEAFSRATTIQCLKWVHTGFCLIHNKQEAQGGFFFFLHVRQSILQFFLSNKTIFRRCHVCFSSEISPSGRCKSFWTLIPCFLVFLLIRSWLIFFLLAVFNH